MYLLLISRFVLRKSSLTSSMLIRCIRTNDATTENAFFAIMNPCNLLNIVDRILFHPGHKVYFITDPLGKLMVIVIGFVKDYYAVRD
jgi:hypothetical protein